MKGKVGGGKGGSGCVLVVSCVSRVPAGLHAAAASRRTRAVRGKRGRMRKRKMAVFFLTLNTACVLGGEKWRGGGIFLASFRRANDPIRLCTTSRAGEIGRRASVGDWQMRISRDISAVRLNAGPADATFGRFRRR